MTATLPELTTQAQRLQAARAYGGGLADALRLRQGIITARDPATYTVTVRLGAGDASLNTDDATYPDTMAGVKLASTVYPRIGDTCFVAIQGAGAGVPVVLFTLGPVGEVKLWRSTDQSITNDVDTNISFSTALSNTDGMWVSGTTVTIGWPGIYLMIGQLLWPGTGSTDANREGRIRRLGPTMVLLSRDVGHFRSADPRIISNLMVAERTMAAGDTVALEARQSGTGGLNTTSATDHAPGLSVRWTGPPAS